MKKSQDSANMISSTDVKKLVSVILIFGLLVGCSNTSNVNQETQNSNNINYGTDGNLISIQSDNVLAAGYDANSMTMTVQFLNGYTYEYYDVPSELWNSFIDAQPHPWSAVGYPQLVQGGFQYRRIS